jgi:predicted NAD/FAD-binding protein
MNIGIVGSGIAGLACARIFRDAGHEVHIHEALSGRGMDSHTLTLHEGCVDMPLRVMNALAWKHVIALAQHVGVGTYDVDTFIACSDLAGNTWLRSSRLPWLEWPTLAEARYFTPQNLKLGYDVWRLQRELDALTDTQTTLREVIHQSSLGVRFWRGLVLPLLTTICTCSEDHLLAWPAKDLLALLQTILHQGSLKRMKGGTRALVDGLANNIPLHAGVAVTDVRETAEGVELRDAAGGYFRYDKAIIATPTHAMSFLDNGFFVEEKQALSDIRFDHGELWLHNDTRFLPARKQDWTALHYQMSPDFHQRMFTVWVNCVEPTLRHAPPVFQTWNPLFEPTASSVIQRVKLSRAVVHSGTAPALARLSECHDQPGRRIYFAGSWAYPATPLLESAVRSALDIGRRFGIRPRWVPDVTR